MPNLTSETLAIARQPALDWGEYWRQSLRPLSSLALVAPLLMLYEGGVLALGHQAFRNGADVWLRWLLDRMGFGQYFLLPLLTVSVLLAWHHTTRDRWRLSPGVLCGMYGESAGFALALLALGYLQGALVQSIGAAVAPEPVVNALGTERFSTLALLVGFFGAGIYEEVLFRLMLLPLAAAALKMAGLRAAWSIAGAVVLTSLAFSAAHYVGPQGDTLQWFGFVFRFMAGAFFAVLFVYRGFGIAAVSHAMYDIFVGIF